MRDDAKRIELDRIAVPPAIRAALGDWRAATPANAQLQLALRMLDADGPPDVVGWAAGLALFLDHSSVTERIKLRHRVEVIPHALDAFVAGANAGLAIHDKLWVRLEELVQWMRGVPHQLTPWLAKGLTTAYRPARDAVLKIALRLGPEGRGALIAARDAAPEQHWLARGVADLAKRSAPTPASELLLRAVTAWRATHDPALEPWIELVGEMESYLRGPCKTEEYWLAVAYTDDPADHARLFDASWRLDAWQLERRLTMLAHREPDPRDARVLDLVRWHGWTGPAIHTTVARIAERAPNATKRAALLAERPELEEMYASTELAASRADPALVMELERAGAPLLRRRELFARHAAHPGDLALRAVLGDAMVEAGDPRGELIAIHLAGNATSSYWRDPREDLLAWFPHAQDKVERGFVVDLDISATAGELRATLDRPDWAMVERLSFRGDCVRELATLIARMPLLVTLRADAAILDELARLGPFPQLRCLVSSAAWLPATRTAFPNLAIVGGAFRTEHVTRAAELGLSAITCFDNQIAERMAEILPHRRLGPPILRFADDARPSISVEVPRDGDRAFLDGWYVAGQRGPRLVEVLDALRGAGFQRLSLGPPYSNIEPYAGMTLDRDCPPIDLEAPATRRPEDATDR